MLLVALIFSILYFKRRQYLGRYSENPAKEGKPFVAEGVKSENAEDHFRKLAKVEYPEAEANIRIKDQKPGFLSTPNGKSAAVEFADGNTQDLRFRNQPGFSGMVSLDGGKTFNEEFYFAACGNPVRQRKSIPKYSGLIFSETPIDFADEPIVVEPSVLETSSIVKDAPVVENQKIESDDTDIIHVSSDHADVASEFLSTQKAHKVTMTLTKGADGTVKLESVFETKNSPAKDKK